MKWDARVPAAAPKMIDSFNILVLFRTSLNTDYSQWTDTRTHTEMCTHMDVELHILPLAETSKFVTLGWGWGLGEGKCGFSNVFANCSSQRSHPPTPLSHLSMNFWKILPLKLSQISTMYGCTGTDTQTADQTKYLLENNAFCGRNDMNISFSRQQDDWISAPLAALTFPRVQPREKRLLPFISLLMQQNHLRVAHLCRYMRTDEPHASIFPAE